MRYDAVIVGSSLAGCAAASLLGRAGLRVAVVDRAQFPRRKPCGEGLASTGLQTLKQVSGEQTLSDVPHLEYSGYRVIAGTTERWLNPLLSSGVTVQRIHLDAALLGHALSSPLVTDYLGEQVRSVGEDNSILFGKEKLSARHIIFAHGFQCDLAEKCGAVVRGPAGSRLGITMTFAGRYYSPPRAVQIFIEHGYELYCTPLAGDRLNVSILAGINRALPLEDLRNGGPVQQRLFDELQFSGELELEPMGRSGIGASRTLCNLPGMWCVGDVAEELDPIGGMGMTHALQSGALAAEWLLRVESGELSQEAAAVGYIAERERIARPLRRFTKLCFGVLHASLHMPPLLSVAASPIGRAITRMVMHS